MKFNTNRRFFSLVLLLTIFIIAIQVYWNYTAYQTNKTQYIFKVQKAFDDAVDAYYFQLGESDVITMLDLAKDKKDDSTQIKKFLSKALVNGIQSIAIKGDSLQNIDGKLPSFNLKDKIDGIKVVKGEEALNQNKYSDLRKNQITIKINRDSLDFKLLKSITDSVFLQNKLKSNYNLYHFKKGKPFDSIIFLSTNKKLLSYSSESDYKELNETIKIKFNNTEKQAMLKGLLPLFLSFSLSMAILFGIIKMITTIKKQKKLSEIKDDFISNITHEFKTPIATASAAIEILDKFDLKSNPVKAKKYLDISNQQLQRLDNMVEKLLELSTLETDDLHLKKKNHDVITLIEELTQKFKTTNPSKNINYNTTISSKSMMIDSFYFTSAISNLIENAIKYGGYEINISLSEKDSNLSIIVADSGNDLKQEDEQFIFDKFSRKSHGNNHDTKGNGIGLYFSKQIIEKHKGSLLLDVQPNKTRFIVTL